MTGTGPAVELPPLLDPAALVDACGETAARERVQAWAVEKDYYLTRLIWALAQARGDRLLLKGGTCLSKVDLGYRRMSEDADFVIPWADPTNYRSTNAAQVKPVREALRLVAPVAGLRFGYPDGEQTERGSHVIWELTYDSELAPKTLAIISVEVAMRPVLHAPRQTPLRQLLPDELAPGYAQAFCWALDADEARAEKVRASLTRDAIRDFYDLGLFLEAGADMTSTSFIELTNRKLAEVGRLPMTDQPPGFGLTPERRARLMADRKGLAAVVRLDEPAFDLDAVIARYDAIWQKRT
jgi:predicted nucleotidyltransferase component of viral defense system